MSPPFDQVFAAEFPPLRAYLYRRLGTAEADDLAAEAFAIAFRRWDDLDPSRPVRPWLYGIAANLLRHRWRSERRMLLAYARSSKDPVVTLDDSARLDRLDAERLRGVLAAALAELRPGEREVLLLHTWADLSDAEIAEALSMPLGTVKSRLSRARERMRNRLAADGQVEVEALTTTSEESQ